MNNSCSAIELVRITIASCSWLELIWLYEPGYLYLISVPYLISHAEIKVTVLKKLNPHAIHKEKSNNIATRAAFHCAVSSSVCFEYPQTFWPRCGCVFKSCLFLDLSWCQNQQRYHIRPPGLGWPAGADLFFAEIGHMSEHVVLTTDKEANGTEKHAPK